MHPARTTGYASKVGVRRESLWAGARRYPEFADAVGAARAISLWIDLGLLGAYDFRVSKFVLEKLLRWTDHVEPKRGGGITLLFDAEDKRRL